MLTVRRPSFRWSLKLRLLQNLAIVEMSSLLQGMSDSPESDQHRGVPSEDLRAGVLAMLHMRTGDGYGLFIVQQKMSLSSSTALANAEKKGHLHNDWNNYTTRPSSGGAFWISGGGTQEATFRFPTGTAALIALMQSVVQSAKRALIVQDDSPPGGKALRPARRPPFRGSGCASWNAPPGAAG